MSLPALTGCISQSGVTVSLPSSVSIATAALGGYNNAVVVLSKVENSINENGSNFDGGSITLELAFGDMKDNLLLLYGYLRASGATSYTWLVTNLTVNQWGGIPGGNPGINPVIAGTAITDQDATDISGAGLGEYISFQTLPAAPNDSIEFNIMGRATNSAGNTNASPLAITLIFS